MNEQPYLGLAPALWFLTGPLRMHLLLIMHDDDL